MLLSGLFIPLVIVLAISQINPIYVNRYLIYAAVFETFLLVFGIKAFAKRSLQIGLYTIVFVLLLGFHTWYPGKIAKVNFKKTFAQVNAQYQDGELIVSATPLSFFESEYYALDTDAVYVYNPKNKKIPPYVGSVLIPEKQVIEKIPSGKTAYIIQENGTYIKIQNSTL